LGVVKEDEIIKGLQPQLHFKNVGNVILEYCIEEIEFVVNTIVGANKRLNSNGGHVFPKMDALFYFPSEEIFNSTTLTKINDVSVRYKLSYKISGTKKSYTSEKTLEFRCYSISGEISEILFKDQKET